MQDLSIHEFQRTIELRSAFLDALFPVPLGFGQCLSLSGLSGQPRRHGVCSGLQKARDDGLREREPVVRATKPLRPLSWNSLEARLDCL